MYMFLMQTFLIMNQPANKANPIVGFK